ncbi:MAG: hypothetical protein IPN71_11160 [Fibrobacteres bacterium]|nr:hypothetical protein [Fibrobacterota bacterium]
MIGILQLVAALAAVSAPEIARCDGVCTLTKNGLEIVVAVGDTVKLQWQGQRAHRGPKDGIELDNHSMLISPTTEGRELHRLTASSGRDPWEFRVEGIPRRHLDLEIRAVGTDPRVLHWKIQAVGREVDRLFRKSGLSIGLVQGLPIYLDRKEWDVNRNERLDLWRNGTIASPAPEQAKLMKQLVRRGLEFPKIVLLQEKSRVGWSLKEEVRANDTVLHLADNEPLVWRDKAGTPMRYVLESPSRDRADTFSVLGYLAGGALRIGTSTGGWKWDHPTNDLVLRPESEAPGFGFVDHVEERAPPVLLIAPTDTSSLRQARILAREVGHALGLQDTSASNNLMSALLRMDVPDPVLETDQVRDLARRMTEIGIPALNKSRR